MSATPLGAPIAVVRDRRRDALILVFETGGAVEWAHRVAGEARSPEREPLAYSDRPIIAFPKLEEWPRHAAALGPVIPDGASETAVDRMMVVIMAGWVGVISWMFWLLGQA